MVSNESVLNLLRTGKHTQKEIRTKLGKFPKKQVEELIADGWIIKSMLDGRVVYKTKLVQLENVKDTSITSQGQFNKMFFGQDAISIPIVAPKIVTSEQDKGLLQRIKDRIKGRKND